MRTKNQIFKGLIILLLVVVSTMGSRAQTDDSDTQLVCPGTEPYKINPGDPGNTFLWSISTGVSGTDWTIVSANSATTDIIWASPLTAQTYTVTFKEVDPLTLCYEEVSLEVTVNPLPVPVIAGPATACENEKDVVYSTPDIPGNTYTWVVTGGTVTAGNETHEITVTWETSGPGTVAVTETVAAANCELTVSFPVKVNPAPAPVIAGKAIVCQNEKDVVYSTPDVSGNTYSWLVKGGIVTAGAVPHEITVTWDAIGPWSVEVTETITISTCNTKVSIPVQVKPIPTTSKILHD